MTDVTIVLSERNANRLLQMLRNMTENGATLPLHTPDQTGNIIAAIEEGFTCNHLRERLAQIRNERRFATDEGEGPPPGDPYWEA